MKRFAETSAVTRAPVLQAIAAACLDDTAGIAAANLHSNGIAVRHSHPFLTIAATPTLAFPAPPPLYRRLVLRFWLLALATGAALWWAALALV